MFEINDSWKSGFMKHPRENLIVLFLAFGMMGLEVCLPTSGHILKHGLFILAFVFLWKGISRLRCTVSDVLLTATVFLLTAMSRLLPPQKVPPLIPEIVALILSAVFLLTGLSLKSIAAERSNKKKA
jgi:hypothetical protein